MATKVRGARRRPGRPLGPAAARGGSGPGARAVAAARPSQSPQGRSRGARALGGSARGAGGSQGGTPDASGAVCKVCA